MCDPQLALPVAPTSAWECTDLVEGGPATLWLRCFDIQRQAAHHPRSRAFVQCASFPSTAGPERCLVPLPQHGGGARALPVEHQRRPHRGPEGAVSPSGPQLPRLSGAWIFDIRFFKSNSDILSLLTHGQLFANLRLMFFIFKIRRIALSCVIES